MWYVLKCKEGQEKKMIDSCRRNLSADAVVNAFIFRCERLWHRHGEWTVMEKAMFPGYVFLESRKPDLLCSEIKACQGIYRVMQDHGYLISVYREEEENLQNLCGESHCLKLSYGFRDRSNGEDCFTRGPLSRECWRKRIIRTDWRRRFAQIELSVAGKRPVIWAGIEPDIGSCEKT